MIFKYKQLIQRKPASRLGAKGAQEVKDHVWLKYYPWKDLYEKKLESSFVPRIGDNFDSKYCNAPDKININTQEKYDQYLKDEAVKPSFEDFYFYFNENDPNDVNNTNEKKFYNSHSSLMNTAKSEKPAESGVKSQSTTTSNLDQKLNKIKQLSNSGSASSLYNKAVGSSVGSSTTGSASSGTTSSYVFRKSGSTSNLNY